MIRQNPSDIADKIELLVQQISASPSDPTNINRYKALNKLQKEYTTITGDVYITSRCKSDDRKL